MVRNENNGTKMVRKWYENGTKMGQTYMKWYENGTKMVRKWYENGTKIVRKWGKRI
jgi:antitoxin component YwqK of YwqJK toxin-antitoxin module